MESCEKKSVGDHQDSADEDREEMEADSLGNDTEEKMETLSKELQEIKEHFESVKEQVVYYFGTEVGCNDQ